MICSTSFGHKFENDQNTPSLVNDRNSTLLKHLKISLEFSSQISGLSALESSLGDVSSPGFNGTESLSKLATNGAVQVSESIFIFLFSAVALDFCFKTGVLSPFPVRK